MTDPNTDTHIPRAVPKFVESEAEKALRSSLEIHNPRPAANAANADLSLNPLLSSSRRVLTPDLYDEIPDHRGESAIDDVLSNKTWRTTSYLGPKRTADDDGLSDVSPAVVSLAAGQKPRAPSYRSRLGRSLAGLGDGMTQSVRAKPYTYALSAAGAALILARIFSQRGRTSET